MATTKKKYSQSFIPTSSWFSFFLQIFFFFLQILRNVACKFLKNLDHLGRQRYHFEGVAHQHDEAVPAVIILIQRLGFWVAKRVRIFSPGAKIRLQVRLRGRTCRLNCEARPCHSCGSADFASRTLECRSRGLTWSRELPLFHCSSSESWLRVFNFRSWRFNPLRLQLYNFRPRFNDLLDPELQCDPPRLLPPKKTCQRTARISGKIF